MSVQDCEVVSADAPSPASDHLAGEQRGSVQPMKPQPAAKDNTGFPRAARLLKHSDFDRVYQQGRRHFSAHMTVFYLIQPENASSPDRSASCARVGFTVGRPLGGAVDRNRIKRRLREAVRLRRSALLNPVDVVINPKKSVLSLEFAMVLEEVGRAFAVITKATRKEDRRKVTNKKEE
jgi:ribonuclease P protein component